MSAIPWRKQKTRHKKQTLPWLNEKAANAARAPSKNQQNTADKCAAAQQQRKRIHLSAGYQAEAKAELFLTTQGLTPIDRNFRCKCGELDLIMLEQTTAVIVEVKLRNSVSHGTAADAVNPIKRKRVTHCASLWWVNQAKGRFKSLRFDVVTVRNGEIEQWIKHAW